MAQQRHEREQIAQIVEWQAGLEALHARIAPSFVRPEVRARAGRYLAGLLGAAERRTDRRLSELLGERGPAGGQRLPRPSRLHDRLKRASPVAFPRHGDQVTATSSA